MWTEDFLGEMIELRDELAGEASGLPTVRSLVISRRDGEIETYLEVEPKPHITYTSPQEKGLDGMSQIQIANQQFQVQGISRRYSLEELTGQRLSYWIDGVVVGGQLIDGIECSLVSIEEESLVWNMTLESRIGEQQIYAY